MVKLEVMEKNKRTSKQVMIMEFGTRNRMQFLSLVQL